MTVSCFFLQNKLPENMGCKRSICLRRWSPSSSIFRLRLLETEVTAFDYIQYEEEQSQSYNRRTTFFVK